jgi:hypothetical protein
LFSQQLELGFLGKAAICITKLSELHIINKMLIILFLSCRHLKFFSIKYNFFIFSKNIHKYKNILKRIAKGSTVSGANEGSERGSKHFEQKNWFKTF